MERKTQWKYKAIDDGQIVEHTLEIHPANHEEIEAHIAEHRRDDEPDEGDEPDESDYEEGGHEKFLRREYRFGRAWMYTNTRQASFHQALLFSDEAGARNYVRRQLIINKGDYDHHLGVLGPEHEYWCEACQQASEVDAGALYECDECDNRYSGDNSEDGINRCPNCGKRGKKAAAHACSICHENEAQERIAEVK